MGQVWVAGDTMGKAEIHEYDCGSSARFGYTTRATQRIAVRVDKIPLVPLPKP
jgi:hypothetical protein